MQPSHESSLLQTFLWLCMPCVPPTDWTAVWRCILELLNHILHVYVGPKCCGQITDWDKTKRLQPVLYRIQSKVTLLEFKALNYLDKLPDHFSLFSSRSLFQRGLVPLLLSHPNPGITSQVISDKHQLSLNLS